MCRLLGYLGPPIILNQLLSKPEHSLIVQSYQPREMTAGLLNADGFGVGWYHPQRECDPFTYRSTLPIWNDSNLSSLGDYIESGCVVASVRSATVGQALDLSNSQPFRFQRFLFTHNGYIENFRKTLYRPLRNQLSDQVYQAIEGTTDSEHIFGLVLNQLLAEPEITLEKALHTTLMTLKQLASDQLKISANIILSDGHRLVASRFASELPVPSLYWLRDDPTFPKAVIIASEPLFTGNWLSCPEHSIVSVGEDLEVTIHQL